MHLVKVMRQTVAECSWIQLNNAVVGINYSLLFSYLIISIHFRVISNNFNKLLLIRRSKMEGLKLSILLKDYEEREPDLYTGKHAKVTDVM